MSDRSLQSLPTVDQAIAILDATPVSPIVTIEIDLARIEEQLSSNVLATDVYSDRDHPAFDRAVVDGFAVRSAALLRANVPLQVVGEGAAGGAASNQLAPGEAMAVMTGAPLPSGADATEYERWAV